MIVIYTQDETYIKNLISLKKSMPLFLDIRYILLI